MGYGNFDVRDFLPGEKAQLFGFAADAHLRLLGKVEAVDHDDHAPDAAVPEGGDAARVVVHSQLVKPLFGNPQAQLFVGFPDNGFQTSFRFFTAAADESPDVGVPALFQQQLSLTGNDGVGAQVGGHGGFRRVLGVAVIKCYDCHMDSSHCVK